MTAETILEALAEVDVEAKMKKIQSMTVLEMLEVQGEGTLFR